MSVDHTDDKSTLVQVMAWCRQAASHYLSQCWPSLCLRMASLGHDELSYCWAHIIHTSHIGESAWHRTNNPLPAGLYVFYTQSWPGTRSVFIIPSAHRSWRGYTGFTLSICPSVRPSVDRVMSALVSSTILAGSISYLHILSNNLWGGGGGGGGVLVVLVFKSKVFYCHTKTYLHTVIYM